MKKIDRTVKAKTVDAPKKKIGFIREEEDFMANLKKGMAVKAAPSTDYADITQTQMKNYNIEYCMKKGLNPPQKKATANINSQPQQPKSSGDKKKKKKKKKAGPIVTVS